ncbi:MAG: cell surface receptor domain protein, partial [Acidobacteriaceae bacterium]|nr:cell surface receptor domain protein [Acidobacteriaceae bacterium]
FSSTAADDDPQYSFAPFYITGASNGRAVFTNVSTLSGCLDYWRVLDLATGAITRLDPGHWIGCQGQWLSSNGDGSKVLFLDRTTTSGGGQLWDANLNLIVSRSGFSGDGALSSDGNRIVSGWQLFDAQPSQYGNATFNSDFFYGGLGRAVGEQLNASGSLLYMPFNRGFAIFDATTGIAIGKFDLSEDTVYVGGSMALDPSGRRLFMLTASGLTVVELPLSPLSVGWVNPTRISTAGSGSALVRGSGFVAGATVSIAGTFVTTQFLDENTLSINSPSLPIGTYQIKVANPNGEKYTLPTAVEYLDPLPVPVLSSINPPSAVANQVPETLTLTGTNFSPRSQAYTGMVPLPIQFVSATELKIGPPVSAAIPRSDDIFVFNPDPGGGKSNSVAFSTVNPVPYISSLTVSKLYVGLGQGFTIYGSGFNQQTIFRVNGQNRSRFFGDGAQIQVRVNAADLTSVGNITLTVFNPAPGGGSSNEYIMPVEIAHPFIGYFPNMLDFGNQIIFSKSSKAYSITNYGPTAWNIDSVDISSDFGQSNNCQALQPGSSCTMTVWFTPKKLGIVQGTATLSSNASGGAISIGLAGVSADLVLSLSRPGRSSRSGLSNAVPAGQNTTVAISVSSTARMEGSVALTCSGVPIGATCVIQPSAVPLSGGDVPVLLQIKTTARPLTRAARLSGAKSDTKSKFGTPVGQYTVHVNASIGELTRSIDVPLEIQ